MSSPVLDAAAAALREFIHRSGALRAQALVDTGPDTPAAIVSCSRLGPIEVLVGEQELSFPHGAELEAEAPDLGEIRQFAPFAVDAASAEVTGTIGGLQSLGDAVARLAAAIGGNTAAVVEFETTTPGTPLVLSARSGEPVLVTIGDESYEL